MSSESRNNDPFQDAPTNQMQSTGTGEERYLHPVSLLFSIIRQIRSNLIPAIFALLGAANGQMIYVVLAMFFFMASIGLSVIRYFTLRYQISDGELVVNEGLIFRRTRTVPVERIQNIDLVQGVLHRIFKVADVRVETASGTKPEATLSVLSLTQVQLLRQDVFHLQTRHTPPPADTNDPSSINPNERSSADKVANPIDSARSFETSFQTHSDVEKTLLSIPILWLAKAGFASNRGFIMVGVLLGLYYQFDSTQAEDFDLDLLAQWMPTSDNVYLTYAAIACFALLALAFLRILGVGWYVLRFFGYRLNLAGDDFRISCGLLTKVSATVPRKRIQFISIHSNIISRTTVSRRWFVPVIPTTEVDRMVTMLRPEMDFRRDAFDWHSLSSLAAKRMVRIAVAVAVIILGPIGFLYLGPWGLLATPIGMVPLIWVAIQKSKSIRYARTPFGVVFQSGILTQKLSIAFFDKIQTTSVEQTPFDRRWGMATLSVDTAAAGPADHRIEIKYLDATFAHEEYAQVLSKSSCELAIEPVKTEGSPS